MTEGQPNTVPAQGPHGRLGQMLLTVLIAILLIMVVWVLWAPAPEPPRSFEDYETPLLAVNRTALCAPDPDDPACWARGSAVAVGDLDLDGIPEIVVAGAGQSSSLEAGEVVTVWHYESALRDFRLLASALNGTLSIGARAVSLVNLDGGSDLEIVTTGETHWWASEASYVSIWKWSHGRLERIAHERWVWEGEDTVLESMGTADFDGDGIEEILALSTVKPRNGPLYANLATWSFSPVNATMISEVNVSLQSAGESVWLRGLSVVRSSPTPRLLLTGTAHDDESGPTRRVDGLALLIEFDGEQVRVLDEKRIPGRILTAASASVVVPPPIDLSTSMAAGVTNESLESQELLVNDSVLNLGATSAVPLPYYGMVKGAAIIETSRMVVIVGWWGIPEVSFVRVLDLRSSEGFEDLATNEWQTLVSVDVLAARNEVAGCTFWDLDGLSDGPEILTAGTMFPELEVRLWASPS